jgi:hypothetical protein
MKSWTPNKQLAEALRKSFASKPNRIVSLFKRLSDYKIIDGQTKD